MPFVGHSTRQQQNTYSVQVHMEHSQDWLSCGHKKINKFKRIEIIQRIFLYHYGIKLRITERTEKLQTFGNLKTYFFIGV